MKIDMTVNELVECFHGDIRVIVKVINDSELGLNCSLKCYQNNYTTNGKYGNLKVLNFEFDKYSHLTIYSQK